MLNVLLRGAANLVFFHRTLIILTDLQSSKSNHSFYMIYTTFRTTAHTALHNLHDLTKFPNHTQMKYGVQVNDDPTLSWTGGFQLWRHFSILIAWTPGHGL